MSECKLGTAGLIEGEDYSFRVDNPDHDFDFVYYWDSDDSPDIGLGYYATDHKKGYPQSGDERGDADDSLRASFTGLNSLGGLGDWHSFPSPVYSFSTGDVSGYTICSWGATHLHVRHPENC